MKIKSHRESHIVELEDGSQWRIFPGDLDVTLSWTPETDLTVLPIKDAEEVATNVLLSDSGPVRVIPAGQHWPEDDVKDKLRDG
jgi:hypothetical protein